MTRLVDHASKRTTRAIVGARRIRWRDMEDCDTLPVYGRGHKTGEAPACWIIRILRKDHDLFRVGDRAYATKAAVAARYL